MKDKHIVVGVSGGIAAYKAVELVSRLRKAGAEVKVVMTRNATKFVAPLTFGEISKHPVAIDMFENVTNWDVEHIAMATWADAYVIAPATANIIGKVANGIADDILSTQIMATKAPVYFCPAMNTNMYENPITQRNIETLKSFGYHVLAAANGELACGTTGAGRLPEPEDIMAWLDFEFNKTNTLNGKTVVVSAGGTQEPIDPVRYIGNRSSGKMGYAIAEQMARAGAKTILVSAPTVLQTPYGVEKLAVTSAAHMQQVINDLYESSDVVIMAAAVADFCVTNQAKHKIKKMDTMALELTKNPDILKGLGEKKSHQKLVGFAAETQDVVQYGKDKVAKKNLDMLVANDVSKSNAGFNVDTNEVTIIYPGDKILELPLMTKSELAKKIVELVAEL